ncbi:nucleotidyltransferase family protein [Paenibacillus sp. F411]|uniref:nucleotidyltransferase domain-containing protein n=1 Tax=Paenibacillus sp. F411 TaxID=2820239 RepID=UPI001AAF2A9B|nr:nucleotidyltransferase family protein [Paenibacillus sp. F411]MBO2943785.1 nucleotidyltransferase family protein [Paenibacillus sp. F411]
MLKTRGILERSSSAMPKELVFMLRLLREEVPAEALVRQCPPQLDWSLLVRLAMHHRVFPRVYLRLKELPKRLVPDDILEALRRQYQSNTVQMLHLTREMSTIQAALEKSGIRCLFLKGPSLAMQLYGDVSLRTSKDLDLLLHQDEVEKAEGVLKELGYIPEEERVLANWKQTSHHVSLKHAAHAAQVELHWRLNPHFSKAYSFDQLWSRRSAISVSGQTVYGLGHEDLLGYLTDHGARHGWFRLRWLMDIVKLTPRLDALLLEHHLREQGGEHYAGQAWILASALFYVRIPVELHPFMKSAKSRQLAAMALHYIERIVQLNPVPEKSVAWHYNRYLIALMDGKQRAAYFRNKLLPNSRDAMQLPLPRELHFLYYVLRPVLWSWRRLQALSKNPFAGRN